MVLNRPIQINVGSKCIVKSLTLAVAQYKSNIQRGFFFNGKFLLRWAEISWKQPESPGSFTLMFYLLVKEAANKGALFKKVFLKIS